MSKNYVQKGDTLRLTAPSGGVVSGSPYLIAGLMIVAAHDAAENETFEAHTVGVWEFTKVTADAPAEGAVAYLVDGTTNVSTSATAATQIGHFTEAQINGDTICKVRLSN